MSEAYYHTEESVNEYIELAKEVNSQPLINRLTAFLSTGASVLELGSGPGTDWNLLSKHYAVTGSDYSTVFLEHLQEQFPSGTFLELDAANLQTDLTFDAIYSNKVLHHLSDKDLGLSVRAQVKVLNPGGMICHSFWKGEGDENFKGMFVNYHSEQSLKDIFGEQFEIMVLEPYQEFEEGDSLFLIGRIK